MPTNAGRLPPFRPDGYLPEGVHLCSEAEIVFRFGSSTPRRRRLVLRLRRWIPLARQVTARRLLVDGSFVTDKPEPNDIDSVVLLPVDFQRRVEQEEEAALELETMWLSRQPEEIFAAEDEDDWTEWVEFFSRTRAPDGRRKGTGGGGTVILNADEYRRTQDELRDLEARLDRLQQEHPPASKGFTKAAIRTSESRHRRRSRQ